MKMDRIRLTLTVGHARTLAIARVLRAFLLGSTQAKTGVSLGLVARTLAIASVLRGSLV